MASSVRPSFVRTTPQLFQVGADYGKHKEALGRSEEAVNHFQQAIKIDPARDPIYLDADPLRLAQIISNLLCNAAKFTDPGGHISLSADVDGAQVVIGVRDNGRGI